MCCVCVGRSVRCVASENDEKQAKETEKNEMVDVSMCCELLCVLL